MTAQAPATGRGPRSAPSSRAARRPPAVLAALALLVALAAGACASAASNVAPDGNEGGAGGVERLLAAPTAAPAGAPADELAAVGDDTDRSSAAAIPAAGPLIVRTGQLDLEVAVLADALTAAERAVATAGGYVAASQREGDGERETAWVTYRVPVERWEPTLAALRALGTKVLAEQTSSEEVTSQVVDLGARLANLRATEAALQAIMAKATKIPDVLEVQAQLTGVREEIERLTAQKQGLEERAALATLTVGFSLPPVVAVTQVREGWDPAADVDRAVATLVGLGQAVASAAIWAGIVVLPLALLLAVALGGAWLVARRLRHRSVAGPGPAAPDAPVA
jgi:hypothetical protein